MKKYRIRISDGNTGFEIKHNGDLRLLENGFEGFYGAVYDVDIVKYANRDGGYIRKNGYQAREMEIRFEINVNDDEWRNTIMKTLGFKNKCDIECDVDGIKRVISAVCTKAEFEKANMYSYTVCSLVFVSPDPFFEGCDNNKSDFRESIPRLMFPFYVMKNSKADSGIVVNTGEMKIINKGEVECGFVAKITAMKDGIKNPVLWLESYDTDENNEKIEVMYEMSKGDRIEIDTRAGHKGIWINGEKKALQAKGNTFFTLKPGENNIHVTADEGMENIKTEIEFRERYLTL